MKENMNKKKFSRLFLERYILNELDEQQKAEIENQLAFDNNLKQKIQQIRTDSELFYKHLPDFNSLEKNIKKQYKTGIRGKLKYYLNLNFNSMGKLAYATIFSVLIIAVLTFTTIINHNPVNTKPVLRSKGNNHFNLFIKRNNKIIKIANQRAACQPKDTLQFMITNKKPVYYAIFGSDSNNNLVKYLPLDETVQMAGSENGENVSKSLIIDEKWNGEIIYCMYSDDPFSISEVNDLINTETNIHESSIFITKYILSRK